MRTSVILTGQDFERERLLAGNRILLIAPPVYDFRLEWSRWHQPTGLLQLARLLLSKGKDVRLIDCLAIKHKQRMPRRKIGTVEIEGYKFHRWHFGLVYSILKTRLREWRREDWQPDTVFITCLNSIWWESVRDTIEELRPLLPQAKFVLGGAYPTIEPEHAAHHTDADIVVTSPIPQAANLPPDLSLYSNTPYAAGIYFYTNPGLSLKPGQFNASTPSSPRSIKKILAEIIEKTELGVREFVFFDEEIHPDDRRIFGALLDKIADAGLDVHFILQGNVPPALVTSNLAQKMHRAHVTQVYLRCNLFQGPDGIIRYKDTLSDYESCVKALLKHEVVKPRGENLAAMLVVGLPEENLEEISERLIRLAHIVGSVILVPFQYVPGLHQGPRFERALARNGILTPERFNSKLYPLALLNNQLLEEYIELTRLMALLNSKYRNQTFDFLGDSLAAKLFRQSIKSEGWNPFSKSQPPLPEVREQEVIPLQAVTVTKGEKK
jgi:hypothetical protein